MNLQEILLNNETQKYISSKKKKEWNTKVQAPKGYKTAGQIQKHSMYWANVDISVQQAKLAWNLVFSKYWICRSLFPNVYPIILYHNYVLSFLSFLLRFIFFINFYFLSFLFKSNLKRCLSQKINLRQTFTATK